MKKMTKIGEAERYFRDVILTYDGNECLPWPFATSRGYGYLWSDGRLQRVHRLVCKAANGEPPNSTDDAAHSCGNGHIKCCAKRHLFWKTHAANMAEMVTHGRSSRGEHRPHAKVTEANVHEIRALRGVMTQRKIASKFGLSCCTVSNIQNRKEWAWLE